MRRDPIDNRAGCLAIDAMRFAADAGLIDALRSMTRSYARRLRASPDEAVRSEFEGLKKKGAALRKVARAKGPAAAVNWNHPEIKRWVGLGFMSREDLEAGRPFLRSALPTKRERPQPQLPAN